MEWRRINIIKFVYRVSNVEVVNILKKNKTLLNVIIKTGRRIGHNINNGQGILTVKLALLLA